MFSARVREKSVVVAKHMHVLSVFLAVVTTLLVIAANTWAVPFSKTKIIIETNATAGDAGIQISLDATEWQRLKVFDPDGLQIFFVRGSGSVGMTGVTELFFESAEPSFEDLPLDQLLARFPAGTYAFQGTTVEGKTLTGRATLTHAIPDGPVIVSPLEGTVVNPNAALIVWNPVTSPFPGTDLPVNVVGYQVIVERVQPTLRVFSVDLPSTATHVTVPSEFMEPKTLYKFEVLAIEAGGNQTISEGEFKTQ
jgi:hypothetical protein